MNEKMNDNFFGKETNHYNFYLSHKIFPKAEVNKSEIVWSNKTPNFEYVFTMPFTMNQRVIGMLENYPFMVELWNRNFDQVDELMGTVKLEMIAILESLKISENLISIVPISKNVPKIMQQKTTGWVRELNCRSMSSPGCNRHI